MPKLCLMRLSVSSPSPGRSADALAAEAAEAADHRLVVAEFAVAGERDEILDQRGDIVDAVRPLRMARDLGLLPGRQVGVELVERGAAFASSRVISSPMAPLVALGERAQFLDLGLELGEGFSKSR